MKMRNNASFVIVKIINNYNSVTYKKKFTKGY